VAHPGDHGGLGPLLDRDTLRAGDDTAPDQRGVGGHGPCQAVGEGSVAGMEGQERQHRPEEVFNVPGLSLVPAAGVGLLALGVATKRP
jgi:hypothetical protein